MIIQNTLFLTKQGSYVHMDHETVIVEHEKTIALRVPLHHLSGLVAYGNVLLSPYLIHRFARDGKSISWMTEYGGFRAQMTGPTTGNVLLRVEQYKAVPDSVAIVQRIVWGKILNQRQVLMRAARESTNSDIKRKLSTAARTLLTFSGMVPRTNATNRIRGIEGIAARIYFHEFPHLIIRDPDTWGMKGRNRRPPRDPVNALLSFGYALLRSECQSACEVVGLDPQVGFLHALRPGRPALALDLMEEFRAHLVDRLVLSLINRGQMATSDFESKVGGAIEMREDSRRAFLSGYQKRKLETIHHEQLDQDVPFGALPIIQARIMARHLRGDIASYQPFLFH